MTVPPGSSRPPASRGKAAAVGSDLGDLAARRTDELHAVAETLAVARRWLRHDPDGGLAGHPSRPTPHGHPAAVPPWQQKRPS